MCDMCGKKVVDSSDIYEVMVDGTYIKFHMMVCTECVNKIFSTIVGQQITTINKNTAAVESVIGIMPAEQTLRVVKTMMNASVDQEYQDILDEMRGNGSQGGE